ncbi:MAG: MBL fold metallo-hydrolase [Undibacterium sp.]|nr:MBL fold metallo-hydrolase [Undibacterium sp.]
MNLLKKSYALAVIITLAVTAMLFSRHASATQDIQLKPIKVSAHVYYFRGAAGVASSANQGFMSNAGFVITNDGVVVYDALATPVLGQAMINAIRSITKKPIRTVIVGHYHADHIYGLQAFKKIGAEIIGHENGQLYLSSEIAQQRLEQRKAELFPWVDDKTVVVAADKWLSFKDKKSIAFESGGIRFQIINSSGAHSSEDVLLFVENDKVLFAGDIYFSGRIPFVGNADSRVWLQTLDRLLDVKPLVVIPGHGGASTNTIQDMQLTKTYLLYLREKMGAAVQDLQGFEEAYQQTDWSQFEKQPAFEQANRLNAFGTYILMEHESLEKR